MQRMASWRKLGGATAALVAIPLLMTNGSCGRSACLVVSAEDLQKTGGACPSMAQAIGRFRSPACGGAVLSVDGPGDLSGQLCCYPVTLGDQDPGCFGVGGFGGGTTCGGTDASCAFDSDCCSGACPSGICTGPCSALGDPCDPAFDDCCPGSTCSMQNQCE